MIKKEQHCVNDDCHNLIHISTFLPIHSLKRDSVTVTAADLVTREKYNTMTVTPVIVDDNLS